MNEWMAGCTNGWIGFGAETVWLYSCVHLLSKWPQGLLGTTDPTQSGCQQGRRGKCFSLCVHSVHELEIKENTKTFRATFCFTIFLFMGSRSDEYAIHRCCVMCTAVYSELLRRNCERLCSGKGRGRKEKKSIEKEKDGS